MAPPPRLHHPRKPAALLAGPRPLRRINPTPDRPPYRPTALPRIQIDQLLLGVDPQLDIGVFDVTAHSVLRDTKGLGYVAGRSSTGQEQGDLGLAACEPMGLGKLRRMRPERVGGVADRIANALNSARVIFPWSLPHAVELVKGAQLPQSQTWGRLARKPRAPPAQQPHEHKSQQVKRDHHQ